MANQIIQNGQVTPGHAVTWVTDGVVQDGGPVPAAQKVLATLFSASFNATSDQPLLIPPAISVFTITNIIVTNASAPLNTAIGGFYTAPVKGGSAIVSGGTNYATLTDEDLLVSLGLTGFAATARFSANILGSLAGDTSGSLAIYFSLTTGQSGPATADIYVIGLDLSP